MQLRQAMALAIKTIRKGRHLTQEDFGLVSSRTYLSSLERGLKSPTIDKLDEIAGVMGVHPATILLLAYAILAISNDADESTVEKVAQEAEQLLGQFQLRT